MEEDRLAKTQESEKKMREHTFKASIVQKAREKETPISLVYLNRQEKHVTFAIAVHDTGN